MGRNNLPCFEGAFYDKQPFQIEVIITLRTNSFKR